MAPPPATVPPRPESPAEPVVLALRLTADMPEPRCRRVAPADLPPADELQKWLDLSG